MTDEPNSAGSGTEPAEIALEHATLDLDRVRRRGIAEAVYCAGKTVPQLLDIAEALRAHGQPCLFTRAQPEHLAALAAHHGDLAVYPEARLAAWPAMPPTPVGGSIAVLAAGTSDLPVATEAVQCARHLGRRTELIVDVGVAGLHRLMRRLDQIRRADCVIVAAGMDGALPSVVAGLVAAPVIGLPTSVGYGAAFEGVAALLSMLNACSPGVAVVNIDNGYGAAHFAVQVTAPARPKTSEPIASAVPSR